MNLSDVLTYVIQKSTTIATKFRISKFIHLKEEAEFSFDYFFINNIPMISPLSHKTRRKKFIFHNRSKIYAFLKRIVRIISKLAPCDRFWPLYPYDRCK
jgi:hypothetical protein